MANIFPLMPAHLRPAFERLISAIPQALVATINESIDLGPCECELLYRFGLPCKHHLLRAARTGEPPPRTLLHPWWWLHGPPVQQLHWEPFLWAIASGCDIPTAAYVNGIHP
jgi:hypothetical protein